MFEFIVLTLMIFLLLNRKQRKRKPRTLDGELKELITESADTTSIGFDLAVNRQAQLC